MRRINLTLTAIIVVAILLVSAIAGTIVYCNGLLNERDSQITSLKLQISNLTSQNSDLSNQVANLSSTVKSLTSANLVSTINATEETDNSDLVQQFPIHTCYSHSVLQSLDKWFSNQHRAR